MLEGVEARARFAGKSPEIENTGLFILAFRFLEPGFYEIVRLDIWPSLGDPVDFLQ